MAYHFMTIEDFSSSPIKGSGDCHFNGSCWGRSQLPESLGRGFADQLPLETGLTLAYTHYVPNRDLLEESCVERSVRSLMIAIALEGESSARGTNDHQFDFIAGNSTIVLLKNVQGTRYFPVNQIIRQLRIIVTEPLLQRYGLEHIMHGYKKDDEVATLYLGQHHRLITQLANSVVALHDCAGSLFNLQIATLSLLAEQVKYLSALPSGAKKMTVNDQDKLLLARDMATTATRVT